MAFVSYAQNFEDVMLWRALREVEGGFYIDVGAASPHVDSVTRAFYERGWQGINIEPTREYFEELLSCRPRDINLRVAVGEAPGTMTLHSIAGTGLSTLDAEIARRHVAAGMVVRDETVEVETLAAICRRHATRAIQFLKVDAEGAERAVLASADFAVFRPWIVLVEATEPNSQVPCHGAWEGILVEAGYRFVWFDGLNRFYVAEERVAALSHAFEVPPNVFDGFVRPVFAGGPPPPRPGDPLIAAMPAHTGLEERIALATRCRDTDGIPKVPDAGMVRTEPDGTVVQIMHNGVKVVAGGYYGDWMQRLIQLCQGHHEGQEERMFHEVMRCMPADAAMIELGGFWAYYTCWFLQGAPGRRAVVVEPDPAHMAVGRRNTGLNGVSAAFVAAYAGREARPAAPFGTEVSGTQLLPCVAVPELMAAHGFERLDMLHCDAQGAEYEVLEGCRALFAAGAVTWVFVSTHHHRISGDALSHQRCLGLLRECGAVIEAAHDAHESFSGDGLIVARFGPAPAGWGGAVPISHARQDESYWRGLAYDLAETLHGGGAPGRPHAERDVAAAYRTLLLREADRNGLEVHAAALRRTGSLETMLSAFTLSPEFRAAVPRLLELGGAGGDGCSGDLAPLLAGGGAVSCSGVLLTLRADGALGAAGESLLVPCDRQILPAIVATGAWRGEDLEMARARIDPARRHVLLDATAGIGLFTRQVLEGVAGVVRAACAEGDAVAFGALEHNLRKYGGRVALTHAALGTGDGGIGDGGTGGGKTGGGKTGDSGGWASLAASGAEDLVWRSDAGVLGLVPWEVWQRVGFAVITLGAGGDREALAERIEGFAGKSIGVGRPASTDAVLESVSGPGAVLYLWR